VPASGKRLNQLPQPNFREKWRVISHNTKEEGGRDHPSKNRKLKAKGEKRREK